MRDCLFENKKHTDKYKNQLDRFLRYIFCPVFCINLHSADIFSSSNQPNIFMPPNISLAVILYLASLGRPKRKNAESVFPVPPCGFYRTTSVSV
jgi:hypothetical protein